MAIRKTDILIGLLAALTGLLISACGATVTSTPLPTLTPTVAATEIPQTPTYAIDNAGSVINYVATGPFNISFPGTFSMKGNTVRLVPEGDGYRLKLDGVIDGESVTAVNGLVRDALRGNLELDKYPYGYFIADSKEIVKPGPTPTQFTASGTLQLHGRTRTVELALTVTLKDGKLTLTGETGLDLLDYEVKVPTAVMNSKITFKANIVALESAVQAGTQPATAAAP